jgi:hypothetical protein
MAQLRATVRLQFYPDFPLDAAAALHVFWALRPARVHH